MERPRLYNIDEEMEIVTEEMEIVTEEMEIVTEVLLDR